MKTIDPKMCNVYFGEFIKAVREEKKLSQEEVATMLGVGQPFLSRIERGQRVIDLNQAIMLCSILEVDLRDFVEKYL